MFATARYVSVMAFMVTAPAVAAPDFAPNPAVGWIALGREFQPPAAGAGPVGEDPAYPLVSNDDFRRTGRQPTVPVADLSNPILQPWTREELRKRNALALAGKSLSQRASCRPYGMPGFLLHVIEPFFFLQTPDKVLILWQGDHEFRHVYLTDRHSKNVKPSLTGESIGHYEGDELVIDTVGISPKTFIDGYYTPHTEQLHVVERIRMIDGGNMLEARFHVEDPGTFTKPWDATLRFRRVEPGRAENDKAISLVSGAVAAGPFLETVCAENPYSYFGGQSALIPQAEKPDF